LNSDGAASAKVDESEAERVAANNGTGRPLGRGGVSPVKRLSPSTRVGCLPRVLGGVRGQDPGRDGCFRFVRAGL